MKNVNLFGIDYPDVERLNVLQTGGGSADFADPSPTTATAEDVAVGKTFLTDTGVLVEGTSRGGNLTPYAIRPDAVLVNSWAADEMVVADRGATIPAYSTSAQTVLAAGTLGTRSIPATEPADYYVTMRILTIPIYSVTTKAKGREEYQWSSYLYDFANIPARSMKALLDGTAYASATTPITACGLVRELYWSSGSALGLYTSTTYGLSQIATAPAISGSTLTIKSPSVSIRGHATYLTSTYFNAITDIRRQYVIELWQAPRMSLNVDAWGTRQQTLHIIDCVNRTDHKLT